MIYSVAVACTPLHPENDWKSEERRGDFFFCLALAPGRSNYGKWRFLSQIFFWLLCCCCSSPDPSLTSAKSSSSSSSSSTLENAENEQKTKCCFLNTVKRQNFIILFSVKYLKSIWLKLEQLIALICGMACLYINSASCMQEIAGLYTLKHCWVTPSSHSAHVIGPLACMHAWSADLSL